MLLHILALQAADGLTLPYALVGTTVVLFIAILGLAARQGAQGQTLKDACVQLREMKEAAQKEGTMSAASRERFASIETLVQIHGEELRTMRQLIEAHHTDTGLHATKEWREDLAKRLDRIENLLLLSVGPKNQHQ
jgi:hypothetical protein